MNTEAAPEDPVVDLPPPPGSEADETPSGSANQFPPHGGRPPFTDVVYPPPPPPPSRSGGGFLTGCLTGCLLAIVLPCVFFGLMALMAVSSIGSAMKADEIKSSLGGLSPRLGEVADFGSDDYPFFREVWSSGDDEDDSAKVVRIPINGVISFDEGRWNLKSGSAMTALQSIRRATLDEDVRGIILEIDSPGGGVTASDIIWDALLEFKAADTNRAVVVMMGDICASGGYYIAAAADHIVAHPTTITGSIGVIIESLNIKELADRLGIKDVSIASGENKQMLNPLHDLTDEQRQLLQNSVDALHGRFVSLVAEGRGLPKEKVAEIADGRVLIAEDAAKAGLVDDIGYFPDAAGAMADLIGSKSLHIVRYVRKASFMDMLQDEGFFDLKSGIRRLEEASRTRVRYMMP